MKKLLILVLGLAAAIVAALPAPVSAGPGGCFQVCSGPAPAPPECCVLCCSGEPCFVPQCP